MLFYVVLSVWTIEFYMLEEGKMVALLSAVLCCTKCMDHRVLYFELFGKVQYIQE